MMEFVITLMFIGLVAFLLGMASGSGAAGGSAPGMRWPADEDDDR